MSRLLCKFFGHRRNIHGIRRAGTGWRSSCIHCHQPLIRISRGAWQLDGRHVDGHTDMPNPDDHGQLLLFDADRMR